jgi:cyanamide hydratase
MSNPAIDTYGWTAVPVKLEALLSLSKDSGSAPPFSTTSITLPSSPLAKSALEYAKKELPIETFNHSLRVFYYGSAILKHSFPSWEAPSFIETYYLACLFHDIGATEKNIHATLLSFEFYGGLIALDVLKELHAPIEQAENVAEAVIRHQDLGEEGTITRVGALIQLSTIFDNMGLNPQLVARETIENITKAYPRKKWSSCFARTIRKENGLKPVSNPSCRVLYQICHYSLGVSSYLRCPKISHSGFVLHCSLSILNSKDADLRSSSGLTRHILVIWTFQWAWRIIS